MIKHLLFVFLFALQSSGILGQVFYATQNRPAKLNWQELNSPHFRIIYPAGFDSSAFRAAKILENEYPKTSGYMGSSLRRFPVILSSYNDLSNGFVSSVNFRSEVDLAPFKGKSINPQSGGWLEAVLPHELVHASHTNNVAKLSIPGLFYALSPDLGRSFNMFPPLGVHEGLAVHYESTRGIHPESGRNNYSFYHQQFLGNLTSDKPWSMSQAFTISDFTIPGNRHYLGSSHFTEWLHQNYGEESSQKMIRRHQYFFFLGYGFSMRTVTGKWPGKLYREFETEMQSEEQSRIAKLGTTTDTHHQLIASPFKGARQRKPIWISDHEVLYFGRQYNEAAGFYVFDTITNQTTKLTEAIPVADFYMEYDAGNNSLLFSEYFRFATTPGAYQSDVVSMNIKSGEKNILTRHQRLFSPQQIGETIVALQPQGDVANLVRVSGDSILILASFTDATPVAIAKHPINENELAVIVNRRGVQAVWLVNLNELNGAFSRTPDIALPNASIHDISWHPSGQRLLFTADPDLVMNVYEWNRDDKEITQLTNSVYNAFEPAYLPDDSGIAYVTQVGVEQRIAMLKKDHFANLPVSYSSWLNSTQFIDRISTPFLGEYIPVDSSWTVSEYKTDLRWLKPRAVLPVVNNDNNGTEWGASFFSIDALQSQSYALEVTTIQDMMWYDFSYTNRTFFPGFRLSFFRNPEFYTFASQENGYFLQTIQEERGTELALPFQWYDKSLNRTSLFRITPSISYSRVRYHNLNPEPIGEFSTQYSAGLSTAAYVGVQQLPRDVQPSRGIVLYATTERTLNTPDLALDIDAQRSLSGVRGKRGAILAGANMYVSPHRTGNHSLRLSAQVLEQTETPLYSTSNIIPLGFSNAAFEASTSLAKISTRYALPVFYPDNGGFLVPFYLSSVYLTGFTHSLLNYENSADLSNAQTILGAGIHFQFKISNLAFEIGTGFAFNPSNNTFEFILGSF